MFKKNVLFFKVGCSVCLALLYFSFLNTTFAEEEQSFSCDKNLNIVKSKVNIEPEHNKCFVDYFVNLTFQHTRENDYCWGPKNYNAFGVTPVINVGKFTLFADQIFGRSESFIGALAGNSQAAKSSSKAVKKQIAANIKRHDIERGWTRLSYSNHKTGYKISFGDVVPQLTFGPMRGIPGVGVSIYRSNLSNENEKIVINTQTPIIVYYPSKVEIKKNGSTIQTSFLNTGIYSIFDLAPEARVLDGCDVKISDQINRSYNFVIDMHSDKKTLKKGEYAFEVYIAAPRRFYNLDPYKNSHEHEVTMNAAIQRGVYEDVTLSAAFQAYKRNIVALFGASLDTCLGLVNNSLGFSTNSDKREFLNGLTTKNGATYEFYFKPKETPFGSFDVFVNVASRGYSSLGRNYINTYQCLLSDLVSILSDQAAIDTAVNNAYGESRRTRLNIRYSPIRIFEKLGVGLAYDMVWLDGSKTRSYDICFDFEASGKLNVGFGLGLTKRGGIEEKEGVPYLRKFVRRMYVALCYKVTDEVEFSNSYDYDAEKISWYCINYKPKKIKGLELEFAPTLYNGTHKRKAIAWKFQYKKDWLDIRVDQQIIQRSARDSSYGHTNKQRILFNTRFSNGKFAAFKKTHYLVDHSIKEK